MIKIKIIENCEKFHLNSSKTQPNLNFGSHVNSNPQYFHMHIKISHTPEHIHTSLTQFFNLSVNE